LLLRQFKIDDAADMYENWASDPDVTEYITWPPHKDVDASRAVLQEYIEKYTEKDFYHWAIILKETSKPIGSIAIYAQNDCTKMVHVGYVIGKNWWNIGIATEALSRLIEFFFNDVGVNRIEACHSTKLPSSGKVMTKNNMRLEGIKRQGGWVVNGVSDTAFYAILAEDYS